MGAGGRGRRDGRRSGGPESRAGHPAARPRWPTRLVVQEFLGGMTTAELVKRSGRALLEVEAVLRKAAMMSKKASQRKVASKAKKAEARVPPTPSKKKKVKKAAWGLPSYQD